jgi:hypothetical protein
MSGHEMPEAASAARIGIQSGSERAFGFMAKCGIGGGSAEGGAVERHMLGFQSPTRGAASSSNSASGWRSATSSTSPPAASRRSERAAPHYEENMKMFGELRLVRALTDEQIAAMRDPRLAGTVKLPTIEDAVKAGGFLAGRRPDIIEQLKAVEKRYPASIASLAPPRSARRSTSSSKTSTGLQRR